ncbi:MAG TPA: hypothetical protein VGO62_11745, partial [Myxococcota bacterium]
GCGTASPYVLDVGICASEHILEFFGIAQAASPPPPPAGEGEGAVGEGEGAAAGEGEGEGAGAGEGEGQAEPPSGCGCVESNASGSMIAAGGALVWLVCRRRGRARA